MKFKNCHLALMSVLIALRRIYLITKGLVFLMFALLVPGARNAQIL